MDISEIRFHCNDLGSELTIKEYLIELLKTLWTEKVGWDMDLLVALVSEGKVNGELDDNGFLDELDEKNEKKANALIMMVIENL